MIAYAQELGSQGSETKTISNTYCTTISISQFVQDVAANIPKEGKLK